MIKGRILHIPFLPATGMAIFPFILVKTKKVKKDPVLIHHERIHLRQQLELLILPFYLLYLLHYLYNLLLYRNHDRAYRAIVFEREAYAMDRRLSYLSQRRPYAWIRFFKK